MNNHLQVPILFIAFNRPNIVKQTFDYIRNARPQKLYVAIDGPTVGKEGEAQLVNQVKEIVQRVNWDCESHFRFNDTNKGAEVTITSAISWVLEIEEYVVILEDDIVAPISFFRFAQEMLVKYKDQGNIWAISGTNFTPISLKDNSDYFFSKYGKTMGWATWRRIWDKFNLNIEVQNSHLKKSFLKSITNSTRESRYFRRKFKRIKNNGVGNSSWDNVASYMHRTNNLLYIIPRVNLISNIGTFGLHAKGRTKYHFLKFDEDFVVENHPKNISCNIEYDKYHFDAYINTKKALYIKILKKIQRILCP